MGFLDGLLPAGLSGTVAVVWLAAAAGLALLFLLGVVAETLLSRRTDVVVRLLRAFFFFLFPIMALLPATMLADSYGVALGLGALFYVVFFVLFCYYLGRRIGREQGRKSISDLVGLDSPTQIEDAQDRLFESRMRFPNRADVVKSIGEMAKAREVEHRAQERRAASKQSSVAEIDVEVEVEGLFEDE